MKTETAAEARVRAAGLAYDRGLVKASRRIRTRARGRPMSMLPIALTAAALAFIILPKRLRGPLASAALPLVAASLRGLFR